MPLYEYKCGKCGHRFELIEKHSASEVKKCPKCGAKAPRQLSAPGIQFKGSGWYVTDYGGKSSSSSSSENSGDGSSSKSDKSEKSEKSEKSAKSESNSSESKSSSEKSVSKKDKK
ncbi:MAG: FmdB family zinc ribbon protein [Candidatus Acidiferrales bacterium]